MDELFSLLPVYLSKPEILEILVVLGRKLLNGEPPGAFLENLVVQIAALRKEVAEAAGRGSWSQRISNTYTMNKLNVVNGTVDNWVSRMENPAYPYMREGRPLVICAHARPKTKAGNTNPGFKRGMLTLQELQESTRLFPLPEEGPWSSSPDGQVIYVLTSAGWEAIAEFALLKWYVPKYGPYLYGLKLARSRSKRGEVAGGVLLGPTAEPEQ